MKDKKIVTILFAVGLIMIVSGGVSSFVLSLQADKSMTRERMSSVSLEYEDFSTNVTKFEEFRNALYQDIFENTYYDTLKQDDTIIKNRLSNYESIVDMLEKTVLKLDSLCTNAYYPDSNINGKCSHYALIYEQVVNYFVHDIHLYNSNIMAYNNYQLSLGSSDTLQSYTTDRDFIDYNKDNQYDGKEESLW